ncbi:GDSL-type esterase/lipase family protein [Aquimarina gracilis]|uniref:GDSL-type esterase/lipase family protein n=1 Tax=Aquimarina gracilis TaxID=874422 RepID=UPI002B45CE87|nr:GDSL-type esterase/lipase family protein [Aquimarina gracilis]
MKRIRKFRKRPLNYGDIVMLGNSITEEGRDWKAKLGVPNARNRGASGDVTEGVLLRLKEIIHFKPKMIFLMIGINDLSNRCSHKAMSSPEYVGYNILKITKKIHRKIPDTKIYLQTILPTSHEFMKDDIDAVNSIIKSNEKNGTYEVIDLNAVFLDEEGLLRSDLTYDGIHLNVKGYETWVDVIKPFLDIE